jgi:hypothetical protein
MQHLCNNIGLPEEADDDREPCVLLQALKDVQPHEPLFYSYGDMDDAAQALLTYGSVCGVVQCFVWRYSMLRVMSLECHSVISGDCVCRCCVWCYWVLCVSVLFLHLCSLSIFLLYRISSL